MKTIKKVIVGRVIGLYLGFFLLALLIVARLNPEDVVQLEGLRDGQPFDVSLTATERSPIP